MDVAECINGRGENHVVTHGPECFYCGQIPTKPFETMRAALEAIQELHKPAETYLPAYDQQGNPIFKEYPQCSGCGSYEIPCATRRLADQGLGDNLARTTKNGENNE